MEITKAVIPAAGMGTRFLPITKAQPKEMLPIIDKPVIHFVVEEAVRSGIKDILIITGRGKYALENYFDFNPELEKMLEKNGKSDLLKQLRDISGMANIHYIRQKEQKGLGDAVLCAERFVGDEPFALMLGDTIVKSGTPSVKQLADLHRRFGCSIVGVERVPKELTHRYGVIKGKEVERNLFLLDGLVEKPKPAEAPSDLAIMGRYVFTPAIFKLLNRAKPGLNGEIQLTDSMAELLKTEKMYAHLVEGKRYDIGSKIDFLKTNVEFALESREFRDEFLKFLKEVVK